MPMKLPKGFQRRKSSGNALEEVFNPPAGGGDGSFRVLDRPAREGKPFDGGITLKLGRDEPPRPPPKDSHARQEDDVFTSGRNDAGNRYVTLSFGYYPHGFLILTNVKEAVVPPNDLSLRHPMAAPRLPLA